MKFFGQILLGSAIWRSRERDWRDGHVLTILLSYYSKHLNRFLKSISYTYIYKLKLKNDRLDFFLLNSIAFLGLRLLIEYSGEENRKICQVQLKIPVLCVKKSTRVKANSTKWWKRKVLGFLLRGLLDCLFDRLNQVKIYCNNQFKET